MSSYFSDSGRQVGKAFLSAMGLDNLKGVRSIHLDMAADAVTTMTIERYPDVAELEKCASLLDQLITERYQVVKVKVDEPEDQDGGEHY